MGNIYKYITNMDESQFTNVSKTLRDHGEEETEECPLFA